MDIYCKPLEHTQYNVTLLVFDILSDYIDEHNHFDSIIHLQFFWKINMTSICLYRREPDVTKKSSSIIKPIKLLFTKMKSIPSNM